jgi:hypothetical protein
MEESAARKELDDMIQAQQVAGLLRRDLALILYARNLSEVEVAKIMKVHPKTAHAFKIDFSIKGKERREKTGKRVHLDGTNLSLKRINGAKVTSKMLSLIQVVLAEETSAKETVK